MPCLESLGRLDMEVRCHQVNNKTNSHIWSVITFIPGFGDKILAYVSVGYAMPVI